MANDKTEALTKLFGNRIAIEGAVIYSIYRNTELFYEYRLKESDFITEEGKLLFKIASEILNKNVEIPRLDKTTLDVELSIRSELKGKLDEYGGSKAVIQQMNLIDDGNFELYYDELMKNNCILTLREKGLAVEKYADKFINMNYSQVCDFVEYLLLNVTMDNDNSCRGVEVNMLYMSDEMVDKIINGELLESISFHDYCPILNNIFNGLTLGTTTMVSGLSGTGKSTFILSNILYSCIKNGEKVVLISNELTFNQYIMMLTSIISVREFKYYGLARDKMNKGKIKEKDEDIKKVREVQHYINTELRDKIAFVNYNSGNVNVAKKMMKKYSKLGYRIAVFDTFKAEDSADAKAWARITEDCKQLTFTAQETNQALIISYQVNQNAITKRNLTRADLSEGKNLITVISNHLIFRYVKPDEFSGEKYDLKPYRLVKDGDKWKKEFIKFENDGKRYIVGTIDKTRFNADGQSILYEFSGTWGVYKEIGYCTCSMDY